MRLFLINSGVSIIGKYKFSGDLTLADGIIASYLATHPGQTAVEVDAATFAAAVITPDHTQPRVDAINELLVDFSGNAKFIRAVLLVILDEVNVIRGLLSPAQPARTVAQLRTAIQNKINAGSAD